MSNNNNNNIQPQHINITIKYQGSSVSHLIIKGVRLSTQIDMFCQMFKITEDPIKYSLLVEELGVYLTDDALFENSTTYIKIEGKTLELQLGTTYQVISVLETMSSCKDHKKSLVLLKSHLTKNFCAEYIRRGGLEYLQTIIKAESASGNTLSVAFGILETLSMCPEFTWDYISQPVIDKVVSNFGFINVNPSLKLGIKLATDRKGYSMLQNSIDKTFDTMTGDNSIYSKIVNGNLASTDINTQTSTLNLINNMVSFSQSPIEFLKNLESYNISSTLKTQLGATDIAFRKQIYLFQCHKIQGLIMDSKTPYNKDEPSHQRLLESLWNTLFPGQVFSRLHENWQLIGFQNKDPSTDFRGMGLAGLKHLIYLANNHKEMFMNPLNNSETNYYPYATSGIQVTSFLVECVKPINLSTTHSEVIGAIYPVLFECENALNEIYCVLMEIFGVVWKEWNATYMTFQKVFQFVSGLASDVLPKCCSVSDFRSLITERLANKKQEKKSEKRSSSRHSKQYNGNNNNSGTTTTTTTTYSSNGNAGNFVNSNNNNNSNNTTALSTTGSGSSGSLNGGNSTNNNNMAYSSSSNGGGILTNTSNAHSSNISHVGNNGNNLGTNNNVHLHRGGDHHNMISCSPSTSSISGSGSLSITNSQEGGHSQSMNSKTFIEDIDIDACTVSPDGNTPLHCSILNGLTLDSITCDININLFLNTTNNQGMTPLNLSCTISNYIMIDFLLHQDTDAFIPSKSGEFPFHNFCSRKWSFDEFSRGCTLFLSKSSSYNNGANHNPLHIISNGNGHHHNNHLSDILNQVSTVQMDTPLSIAVKYGLEDNVRHLLTFGPNINNYFNSFGQNALHIAVSKRNVHIINALIQNGADPSIPNEITKETCEMICGGDPEIMIQLNPTKLSRSTSSSTSSSTSRIPDEANFPINVSSSNNSISSISSNNTTTVKKNPIPLPKRPQQANNNNSNNNNISISNSNSNSNISLNSTINNNNNNNNSSSNNNSNNVNNNNNQTQQQYVSSPYNAHKSSISSPNHNITPSTSPGITSPTFRSATPLKQTMSIGLMNSPTQESPPQVISTPTSPPYLSNGSNTNGGNHGSHNYVTRGNSGFFNNIINTVGENFKSTNLSSSNNNITNNSNGNNISNNNNYNISNNNSNSNNSNSSSTTPSFQSYRGNNINTSPIGVTVTPPKDQKKADSVNNIKRLLNESLCLVDLICSGPEKQKENVKKLNEALKLSLKNVKNF